MRNFSHALIVISTIFILNFGLLSCGDIEGGVGPASQPEAPIIEPKPSAPKKTMYCVYVRLDDLVCCDCLHPNGKKLTDCDRGIEILNPTNVMVSKK